MLFNFLRTRLFIFVFVTTADGSHFLGGTITWRIQNISDNNISVAILITQTSSWTYVSGRCDGSSIANNLPVSGAGGGISCSPSCPSGFGALSATPYCTDISTLNGMVTGQRLDTVVIPTGSDFYVIFSGSAWVSLTFGGGAWSITSHINLVRRSDNNMLNNAPVATTIPLINIQVNQTTVIPVSVSDADGDIVRCRWPSSNGSGGADECGSACPPNSLPANTILHSNCIIEINDSIVNAAYSVALIVEDFIDSFSTSPLSSVPVQFVVKVIAPPSCSTLPEVVPVGSSCTTVTVNDTFTSQLLAINSCGVSVSIIDISTVSLTGMLQGSLTKLSSTIYYKTLTWTPTINQLGYQVMCAMALSSQNVQSPQYCFTFYVTENDTSTCPTVRNSSTTTIPSSTTSTSSSTTSSTTSTTSSATTQSTTSTSSSTTSSTTSTTSSATTQSTTSTAKISTTQTINWPVLVSVSVSVLLFAIIYSSCILRRYYKRCINKRRPKFHINNSVHNIASSALTRTRPPTNVSVDPVYTVKNESANKSSVSLIPSVDEKVDNNDVEQISVPRIIYPRKSTVQIPSDELRSPIQSYRASTKMENDIIHVRNVPLPVERMITESPPSPIETINLSLSGVKSQQSPKAGINRNTSFNIVHAELMNGMKRKVKTENISHIPEVPVEKARKRKVKHKQVSGVHVTIRKS